MTPLERESIINEAVEKALEVLPDVWANLARNHKVTTELNSKFYKDHQEFKGHEDAVVSVLSEFDGNNPLLSYQEKLDGSVPGIKNRIAQMKGLDTETVNPNPDRSFQRIESAKINGDL